MRNLLNFLVRYGTWFLFAFYVFVSCVLLVLNNDYQNSVYLTSANAISSSAYSISSEITGYFHLKSINESLQQSNARLENEVLNLRQQLAEYKTLISDSIINDIYPQRFDYVSATVINNNVRHPKNYFSINKGFLDGVERGMGVVDQNGVVGIVNVAGKHTARVISLLNETQHFSVRIQSSPYVGSLTWKGGDPSVAYMEEVPRHAKYNIGDTVVTSGYSMTFPEGIPVGTVMTRVRGADENFFVLKIKLNSNFKSLSTVRVIKDIYKHDLDSLQIFDFQVSN